MIAHDEKRIIVDVGHFGNRDAMLESLKSKGLGPANFDIVLLTHIHWDHCLNVDLFSNAKILVGEEELERGSLTGTNDAHTEQFRRLLRSLNYQTVRDGYQVTSQVKVVSTPGHSPGHLSVLVQDGNAGAIITGDAIPNLRTYKRGVPDFIFDDPAKAKASVQKIKDLKCPMLIPGHDSPFNESGYLSRDDFNLLLKTDREEDLIIGVRNVVADQPQLLFPK